MRSTGRRRFVEWGGGDRVCSVACPRCSLCGWWAFFRRRPGGVDVGGMDLAQAARGMAIGGAACVEAARGSEDLAPARLASAS